jgi:CDP-6-deoxy-D-xylo-4-hexulose-3-dehydrase
MKKPSLTPSKLRAEISDLVENYANLVLKEPKFIPGVSTVPPSGKLIGSKELKLMVEASLDGWLTSGRFNEKFESELANFLGINHLITVNSGSSANLIAFNTLTSHKLGTRAILPGDEVIGVAAGFPTTVNPILQFGAVPVFIDVEIPTYNIDPSKIEEAITSKTKAVMLAHTLGNPFNLDVVKGICEKYNLWLIEDCCDALGSMYKSQLVGTFGDIGTLSFYPAHHITMGEGGAVFMKSAKLRKIAESLRDWGRDCYCPPGVDNTCNNRFCWSAKQIGGSLPDGYDHKYTYSHLGYNLKITDMQAACGCAQIEKLDSFIKIRKENFQFLYNLLEDLEDELILPKATQFSEPSWFGFPISVREDSKIDRDSILKSLNDKKIGTRLLFAGNLTRQPYMEKLNFKTSGNLVNTDFIMNNTFWIGLQPSLNKEMLSYSVETIKKIIQK